MKHPTSTLSGAQLDQAVAMALGLDWHIHNGALHIGRNAATGFPWSPSTNWAHGGPLLSEHLTALDEDEEAPGVWWASQRQDGWQCMPGQTPLIAICRAIVASKLGDEVDL